VKDIFALRLYARVARLGSFSAAARECGLSHSQASRIVADLDQLDQAAAKIDDALLLATVNTNLIGSIRMTSVLIEHLKTKEGAVVAYTSSVLGFVPLALTAVYSATKAALHSYALSQRFMLRDTKVRVLEIAPPWVRTELLNSQDGQAGNAAQSVHRRGGRGPCD
jgi:uncharacterized oxidoreductase